MSRSRSSWSLVLVVALALFAPSVARAQTHSADAFDLEGVQGLLAIKHLDGWLLTDYAQTNPIAADIVSPRGPSTRRWYYFIPKTGMPTLLVAKTETKSFAHLPGERIEYSGYRELDAGLRKILPPASRKPRIAMEYSPNAELPDLSRVDAGTVEKIRALKITIEPSADLVQAASARWVEGARQEHYLAVHHLVAVRTDALLFLRRQVKAGKKITEVELAQRMAKAYRARGLDGGMPIVAVAEHSAEPSYRPTAAGAREIRAGDLLLIDMWAKKADSPAAVYAEMTWMVYVGSSVPEKYAGAFDIVAKARDTTVALLKLRLKAHMPVKGFEADNVARQVVTQAGQAAYFVHRTGHSIDTRRNGFGANLDDFETHDARPLLFGTGFTIEPGLYYPGEYGVRAGISCFIGADGLEVTTPVQTEITALFSM